MHFMKCENPNIFKRSGTNIIDLFSLIVYEDGVFTTDSLFIFLKHILCNRFFFSVGPKNLHEKGS